MVCRAGKVGWLGVLVSALTLGVAELPAQTTKPEQDAPAAHAVVENSFAPRGSPSRTCQPPCATRCVPSWKRPR